MDRLVNTGSEPVVCKLMDLTFLDFSSVEGSSGTAGSFLKAIRDGKYYKASYISGYNVIGHESVNECIANEVCKLFGFRYLEYELINAVISYGKRTITTWLVSSNDFRGSAKRITLEMFLKMNGVDIYSQKEVYSSLFGLLPKEVVNDIFHMCVIDFIIYNRDRHGANIELLQDENGYRLAPIFDCGSSLLAPLQNDVEAVKCYDVLSDKPVNNFIGSMYLSEMITMWDRKFYIPEIIWNKSSIEKYRKCFPDDCYIDKINEMIEKRLEWLYEIWDS